VAQKGPLRVRDAIGWVLRVAKTLEQVHDQKRVHGRISAAAIQVASEACDSAGAIVHPRDLDAQPEYHSLARARTGAPSAYDDVWALRVTLYVLLTGKPPFPGGVSKAVTASGHLRTAAQLAVYHRNLTVMQPLMDEILEADERVDLLAEATVLAHQLERFSPSVADLPALDAETMPDLAPQPAPSDEPPSEAPSGTAKQAKQVADRQPRQGGQLRPVLIALVAAALVAGLAFGWLGRNDPPGAANRSDDRPDPAIPKASVAKPPRTGQAPSAPPTALSIVSEVATATTAASAATTAATTATTRTSVPQRPPPLTGTELAECLLPVVATKLTTAPELDFICDDPSALSCVHKLNAKLVRIHSREGRGAARAWERLGWYQMAALALARQRCCATPSELTAPAHLRGCHLDKALAALMANDSEAAFITALEAYTKASRCIEFAKPKDWPCVGSPTLVQQSALLRKRSQALGSE